MGAIFSGFCAKNGNCIGFLPTLEQFFQVFVQKNGTCTVSDFSDLDHVDKIETHIMKKTRSVLLGGKIF
jgi:hypothetical protein